MLAAANCGEGHRRMRRRGNDNAERITCIEEGIEGCMRAHAEVLAHALRACRIRVEEAGALRPFDLSQPSNVVIPERAGTCDANAEWRGQTTTPRALSSRNARKC